jgi:type IV fimbrial biogenesis protein FimT
MAMHRIRCRIPSLAHRGRGMTLVELAIAIALVAILATIAMPNLTATLANQRLRSAGTDLMSALLIARSEAIKRNAQVEVAPLAGRDWKSGWRVRTVDSAEQVDRKDALGIRVDVAFAPDNIVYERTGRLTVAGTTQLEFRDSESGSTVPPRCVSIDPSGLPRLEVGSCL